MLTKLLYQLATTTTASWEKTDLGPVHLMATNAAQETHCKSLLFTEMTYARETANDVKATNPIFNIKILANEWQKI